MRDIRFRAWDNEGKWFLPNIQNHIGNSETAFGYMLRNDRYVIEQFTGLRDKNGKEIYEGDILKEPVLLSEKGETVNSQVIWSNGRFIANGTIGARSSANSEIIGNIHEKPEVLNG